jgi:hypothetical protein
MPFPEMGENVTSALAKSRLLTHHDAQISVPRAAYDRRTAEVLAAFRTAEKQCDVHIIHVEDVLCDKTACAGVKDGLPLYLDDNHISQYGNDLIKPLIVRALQQR